MSIDVTDSTDGVCVLDPTQMAEVTTLFTPSVDLQSSQIVLQHEQMQDIPIVQQEADEVMHLQIQQAPDAENITHMRNGNENCS